MINDAIPTINGSLSHPVTSLEMEFYQLAPVKLLADANANPNNTFATNPLYP
jgi:hypothetical protein